MKVYFGSAVNDMLTELRGQATNMVRLHVLPKIDGQNLVMQAYITALCNNQIFESISEARANMSEVTKDKSGEFARDQCEQLRTKLLQRLEGFEVRRGIFQE